ncbi:BCD family MFS transporter [Aerophototrophica crusticola]|uniref:BCD family MFS transporter n=2 Tax=Aerophototrophica crusticola TaxID=1709002 RepID=A0A858RA13_9PROT|nr:BCD family MFS transporter [Rhodospirillaceae bacterium B3]
MKADARQFLGWLGMVRFGLVQAALGAIVVLTTSTMNRVMVVELALPAMLPGALVALHFAVQVTRPRMGHGSDVGGRRTPWIIGGMAVLALGGVLAALSIGWLATDPAWGTALAVLAFLMIGLGVGAAGTSLLVLMASRVASGRRAAAATVTWVMMIVGFIVTTAIVGSLLDPFSPARLLSITASVAAIALAVSTLAVWGLEGRPAKPMARAQAPAKVPFRAALAQVWGEPAARGFAVFVFLSMLAYSAQDLILEPFAGAVFGLTPGETTKLSSLQHGGVLAGMILVAIVGSLSRGKGPGSLRAWTVGGCVASALTLASLGLGGLMAPAWPLKACVFALGIANGAFAVAAIGSMMERVGAGSQGRDGVRMGLWGAAQAIAFGLGGFLGTAAADLARAVFADPGTAYAAVFLAEGVLFLAAAQMALRLDFDRAAPVEPVRTELVGISRA